MATKKKVKPSERIHQMKISLKGAKPPIWRRVLVPGELTLGQLHTVIQRAMGWYGGHLHMFMVGGMEYGRPDPDWEMDGEDEDRVTLDQLRFSEKSRFLYQYDFGDDWAHDILVEKILPREAGKHYPVCIKGSRACPPEDVGGIWGYEDFLEAIRDPKHPEHEQMLDWVGGEFDSEAFDLDQVNWRLKNLR